MATNSLFGMQHSFRPSVATSTQRLAPATVNEAISRVEIAEKNISDLKRSITSQTAKQIDDKMYSIKASVANIEKNIGSIAMDFDRLKSQVRYKKALKNYPTARQTNNQDSGSDTEEEDECSEKIAISQLKKRFDRHQKEARTEEPTKSSETSSPDDYELMLQVRRHWWKVVTFDDIKDEQTGIPDDIPITSRRAQLENAPKFDSIEDPQLWNKLDAVQIKLRSTKTPYKLWPQCCAHLFVGRLRSFERRISQNKPSWVQLISWLITRKGEGKVMNANLFGLAEFSSMVTDEDGPADIIDKLHELAINTPRSLISSDGIQSLVMMHLKRYVPRALTLMAQVYGDLHYRVGLYDWLDLLIGLVEHEHILEREKTPRNDRIVGMATEDGKCLWDTVLAVNAGPTPFFKNEKAQEEEPVALAAEAKAASFRAADKEEEGNDACKGEEPELDRASSLCSTGSSYVVLEK